MPSGRCRKGGRPKRIRVKESTVSETFVSVNRFVPPPTLGKHAPCNTLATVSNTILLVSGNSVHERAATVQKSKNNENTQHKRPTTYNTYMTSPNNIYQHRLYTYSGRAEIKQKVVYFEYVASIFIKKTLSKRR